MIIMISAFDRPHWVISGPSSSSQVRCCILPWSEWWCPAGNCTELSTDTAPHLRKMLQLYWCRVKILGSPSEATYSTWYFPYKGKNDEFVHYTKLSCLLYYSPFFQVTDNGLEALSKGFCSASLTELHIDGCTALTSKCGVYLQQLTNVSTLSFYNCPSLLESEWFLRYLGNCLVWNPT